MLVSAVPPNRLASQARSAGIHLPIGPFVIHIQSALPQVAEGIGLYYNDSEIRESDEFADFHVTLNRPKGLRRWYRPQVQFALDGFVPFKPLPANQAFPMFEWCLNWCISNHIHRYLIIHAAVVEKGGYAAILPGPPGSGKSTLCASLALSGWRLLTDELALVSLDGCSIIPLPRPVSLKNESIEVIRRFSPQATLGKTVSDTVKGTVTHMRVPVDSVRRSLELAQPAWIIMPRYEVNAPTELVRNTRGRTLMALADLCFNYSLLGRQGFEVLANLVDASECFGLTYSDLEEALRVIEELSE
jgi:HprK-related kinase A